MGDTQCLLLPSWWSPDVSYLPLNKAALLRVASSVDMVE